MGKLEKLDKLEIINNIFIMAVVTVPCLSVSASGSIGKTITFSIWKGKGVAKGSYLKKWNGYYFKRLPPDSETIKQNTIRDSFSNAVTNWKKESEEEKKKYNDMAIGKALTGFNIYVGNYINNNINYELYTQAYLQAVHFGLINEANKIESERLATLGRLNEHND